MRKILFFLVIALFSDLVSSGQIMLEDQVSRSPLGAMMEFQLADPKIQMPAQLDQTAFMGELPDVPNFNVTRQAVWLKFTLSNKSSSENFILDIAQPQLEFVELHVTDPAGKNITVTAGFFQKYHQRVFPNQNYCFPINVPIGQQRQCYLKIMSGGQIQVPVYIGTPEEVTASHSQKDLLFGLFSGVMLAMFVYNLFVFLFSRERSYLLYVVYIGIVYATQANFQGYTIRFFWPESPWMEYNATTILSCLAGISATFFFIDFVHLREYGPKMQKWLYGFIAVYVLAIGLAFFGQPQIAYVILQGNAFFLALVLMVMAIWLYNAGVRQALYFLIAWAVFLTGVCIFILKDFGILPYNTFTYNVMSVGSALEAVFLSMALAERINVLKKEKEESQVLALKAMHENESIVRRQNEILEEKVNKRTSELQRSNLELTRAMSDLKNAQIKLVENEKMASLGQLVAGIAHELNNPINFVLSNVSPLRRDLNEYFKLAEMVQQSDAANPVSLVELLKSHCANLENEGLKNEIELLMKGIEEGAERTAEIVKGLRIFSRLDEQDLKKANVNDCIKSTMVVLKSLLRNKVKIIKELGDLEPIDCFPGKLNQVFMNLVNNAYHAIQAAGKSYPEGEIRIITTQTSSDIIIRIKDNGVGMTEDVVKRVFDPFFTTKEVGEGTGLGMSIVLGIINDHNGKIHIDSHPKEGTEIVLFLPRNLTI